MEITISGKDRERLKQIEELANQLGLNISRSIWEGKESQEEMRKNAWAAIKKLQELEAFKDIDDPVAWQREQRRDRNIGRNE